MEGRRTDCDATATTDDCSCTELERIERGLFFIVGAGCSGATLLQVMLSSHSRITIPPETEFFKTSRNTAPPDNAFDPDAWQAYLKRLMTNRAWLDQQLDPDEFVRRVSESDRSNRAVFLTMLAMQGLKAGKPRVGEKTPTHFRKIRHLHRLFPDARFVHIYRDPRDVVASAVRKGWFAASHVEAARQWCNTMHGHKQHVQTLPGHVYTSIRFETLLEECESELKRICRFLDEPFEPDMLPYDKGSDAGSADWQKPWKESALQPLDKARIGAFRQDLSPRQIAVVQRVIGSRLERYGYRPVDIHRSLKWLLPDCYDKLAAGWRRLRRKLRGRR